MKEHGPVEMDTFILKIIWGALLFSQFLYSFLAYNMFGEPVFVVNNKIGASSILFSTAALSCIVMGYLLFSLLVKPIENAASFAEAKQKFFLPFVVRLVLIEACSILGFAFSSMEQQNLMLNFSVIAILAFIPCFPTDPKIRKLMR